MRSKTIKYPIDLVLTILGDKWSFLILCKLRKQTYRFNELQRDVTGISTKMLTQCLKNLEQHGLVSRQVYPEVPPRVEYCLTDLGISLEPVMESMFDWGLLHQSEFQHLYEIQIDSDLKFPK